ncbi:superoxide dismutase family protein [Streptomyces sp. DSM 44915]|uniref:Superoxide dismutase family protein n=1 Tax=Streptomyces chisholmiae TaxID=3075540 RepID=A0ABU2JPU9_9ACTN|nr:superoxide dismutase family protein [Streptomyces sp. DSM 44915]MDT0266758.1 superoxide dismutase family protein [Streptomyces sp. DSM 44915]
MKSLVTGGLAVLLAAAAGTVGPAAAAERTAADDASGWSWSGVFAAPAGDFRPAVVEAAVTYDEELVPAGAAIAVTQRVVEGRTRVELRVEGVNPGHTYGAHVHTSPCGDRPGDSGPHYQDEPSDDPRAANPENEVWLDVTADGRGAGRSTARQDWLFRADEAHSVVLHEHATATGHHGTPGDAGARVACFTLPFQGVAQSGRGTGVTLPAAPLPAPPPGVVATGAPSGGPGHGAGADDPSRVAAATDQAAAAPGDGPVLAGEGGHVHPLPAPPVPPGQRPGADPRAGETGRG